MHCHEVDYEFISHDMQMVEVELEQCGFKVCHFLVLPIELSNRRLFMAAVHRVKVQYWAV